MTATARADIGARFKARPKSVGLGCVQTCDDVCRFPATISIESLLCVRPRASDRQDRRSEWPRRAKEDATRCRSCIRMHRHRMLAPASCTVAVSADRDPTTRTQLSHFHSRSTCTGRLLVQCGIRSVAMESTSVYWIPVYQILEARALKFISSTHNT